MVSQQIRWLYGSIALAVTVSLGITLLLWPRQPYYAWGIFILFILLAWIAVRPLRGVFISIVLTGFIPQASQEIGFGEISFLAILGTALVSWLLKGFMQQRVALIPHRVTASLIALFVVFLLSMPLALARGTTLYEWARGLAPFAPLLVFFVVTTEARDEKVYRQLLWAFMLVGLWLSLQVFFTFWQERLWEPIPSSTGGLTYRRVTWIFPSSTSPLILAGALIALVEYLLTKSRIQKLIFGTLMILLSGAILLTLSRSEIAVLIFSSIFILFMVLTKSSKRSRLTHLAWLLGLISLLLFTFMATIPISPIIEFIQARGQALVRTLESLITPESSPELGDVNIIYRIEEIRVALQAFLEQPLVGQGLGYSFEIPSFEESKGLHSIKIQYIHNILAYFLMTTGLLGTTIFAILIVAAFFAFVRKYYHEPSLERERVLLASGIALLGLWLYGLFFAVFRTVAFNLFVGVALAILTCYRSSKAVDRHGRSI